MLISLGIYLAGQRSLPADHLAAGRAHGSRPQSRSIRDERRNVRRSSPSPPRSSVLLGGLRPAGQSPSCCGPRISPSAAVNLGFWQGEIPAVWFLALNPLMIFVLTPILVRLWTAQARRQREPLGAAQDGVRLRLRDRGLPADGRGGERRRQGEPALARRLFRHRHARRTLPRAGRARAGGRDSRPRACAR